MKKLFFLGVVVCLFMGCKQEEKTASVAAVPEADFETKKFPPKVAINARATDSIKNWPEFKAFETSFEAVYRIENKDDLSLVLEDLIEKQKLFEASVHPKLFDNPQIRSRQRVLKTFILKTKGNLEYQIDTREATIEMITAYNALRNQFNVMVNNTLDTKLIFDE